MKNFEEFLNEESTAWKLYPCIVFGLENEKKNRKNAFLNSYMNLSELDSRYREWEMKGTRSYYSGYDTFIKMLIEQENKIYDKYYAEIARNFENDEIVCIGNGGGSNLHTRSLSKRMSAITDEDNWTSQVDIYRVSNPMYASLTPWLAKMNNFSKYDGDFMLYWEKGDIDINYYLSVTYISKRFLKALNPISKVDKETYELLEPIYSDKEKYEYRGKIKLDKYDI